LLFIINSVVALRTIVYIQLLYWWKWRVWFFWILQRNW